MTYKEETNQLIEADPEMPEMVELADEENMNTVMRKMKSIRKKQMEHVEMKNTIFFQDFIFK